MILRRNNGNRKHVQRPERHRKLYWYVWGMHDGRHYLSQPCNTEADAEQDAIAKLSGNYEIVCLPTRDMAEASRILRARVAEETEDYDETFKRFKHNI